MLRRRWTVCAMTALLFGGTAAAQQPGTLLLGGFGQYTWFDDALQLKSVFGGGGRVGAYFAPNWNLEWENSYNKPEQEPASQNGKSIWYGPPSLRVRYSFPVASWGKFHVGAGGLISSYAGYEPDEPTGQELIDIRRNARGYNYGVQGDLGFSFGIGSFAGRIDGIVDYMPNGGRIGGATNANYDGHTNFRVQAGLEWLPDIGDLFGTPESRSLAPWRPYAWWDELGEEWALPGMLEIGGFAQYTFFDDNTPGNASDGWGYGGRLGIFLSDPHWQIEGDGQDSPDLDRDPLPPVGFNRNPVSYSSFALRANYNIPVWSHSQVILGLGGVRTNYSVSSVSDTDQRQFTFNYGVSGLIGLRWGITNRVAIRLDGVGDYMKDTENFIFAGRGGLSLLVGGARREVMCTYAGLENIPASSPSCVPPPPPPPPPAMCPYPGLGGITQSDPACVPPAPPPAIVDTAAITAPIYFDFDKSDIRTDAAAILDRKIPWLNANPGMRIRIEGNADERGSDEYNLALGQRRAAAAKRYLVERGIDAGRFDLVSYGEERPVCTEHDESCWQRNRRDDFVIVTIGADTIVVPPGGED